MAQFAAIGQRLVARSGLAVLAYLWIPVALAGSLLLGLLFGPVHVPPGSVVGIVAHHLGIYQEAPNWGPAEDQIVWNIRLPEVLAAALVGAALSLAGALFQAVLRNPLADPYVIGTSAGAQLGVTIALILPIQFAVAGFGSVQILAFAGALATVLLVYLLARSGGTTPVVTLILAGFVTSSFLVSVTSFLAVVSTHMSQIVTWTMGGVQVGEWGQLGLIAPIILVACGVALMLSPQLDALLLGEEQAAHLGIRVERLKLGAVVVASLVTALAVTLAGIVAFVGLIIPHAVRLVYGPGHRVLLPAAAALGGTFVVLVDLLARTVVAPTQLPLGVMTAVVGAPFFLHLLRRGRREYAS
ncbi:MAG TPA: iron ABC transporter permease [Chloroflexota bacterium]|nr:iron ABC transporter permease [Chloroflexota bacterium]